MTTPTGEGLSSIWAEERAKERRLRSIATNVKTRSQAGQLNADEILEFYAELQAMRAYFTALSSVAVSSGLQPYVDVEHPGYAGTVATDLAALSTAIGALISWIDTNFPASAGYLLAYQVANGTITARTFTTGQTSTFRTAIDALLAAMG